MNPSQTLKQMNQKEDNIQRFTDSVDLDHQKSSNLKLKNRTTSIVFKRIACDLRKQRQFTTNNKPKNQHTLKNKLFRKDTIQTNPTVTGNSIIRKKQDMNKQTLEDLYQQSKNDPFLNKKLERALQDSRKSLPLNNSILKLTKSFSELCIINNAKTILDKISNEQQKLTQMNQTQFQSSMTSLRRQKMKQKSKNLKFIKTINSIKLIIQQQNESHFKLNKT